MTQVTDAAALRCKETASLWHGVPRHCTTHGCEIISSKCANMQNRSYNGLELKCINDYDILNSPCAAQPPELCCPNFSKGPARNSFSMTEEEEAKSMLYIATSYLLTFTHLTIAGLERKRRERGWDFSSQRAGSSRFHLSCLSQKWHPF